jgi:hypothetical protein
MSGHKRTTVSLSELDLRRLEGVEERLKTVENDYQRIRERVKKSASREMQEDIDRMTQRQNAIQEALNHALSDLYEDVFQADKHNMDLLIEHAHTIHNQISDLGNGIWDKTSEIVEHNLDEFKNFFERSLIDRDLQIERLHNEILQNRRESTFFVEKTLEGANIYLQELVRTLPIDRYFPNYLKDLQFDLQQAYGNFYNGFLETSLGEGQKLLKDLMKLRLDVERKEIRRLSLLTSVRKRLQEDILIYEHQDQVSAIGLDGEDLGFLINVPYWSGGHYSDGIRKLKVLLNQIEEIGDSLDEEELADFHNVRIRNVEELIKNSIQEARRNVLASQVRFNIADCVVKALENQGFVLSNGHYEDHDQRSAYQVDLKHIDGSEVTVHVSPIDGEIGRNVIDLETKQPELRTENELKQRAREVAVSLAQYGLQVGNNKHNDKRSYLKITKPSANRKNIKERRVIYGRN